MNFILTIVLFSGSVVHQSYKSIEECNSAMYDKIDQVLIKNVKVADCKQK